MDEATAAELFRRYPALASLDALLREALLSDARATRVESRAVLFEDHQACLAFPMLLSGSIRVSKASREGRELQLYRVQPGESCILTTSCLVGHARYAARGVAETDVRLVALSPALFARLIDAHPPFRAYVFELFSERLAELMALVEEVAFRRLDQRLAALLVARGPSLRATHQDIADELGSVREIVSRLLGGFADQGLVELGRERIEVLDRAGLAGVAGAEARAR